MMRRFARNWKRKPNPSACRRCTRVCYQLIARPPAKILPGDLRRIVRALEVHALTGKPISELQSQWGVQAHRSGRAPRLPQSAAQGTLPAYRRTRQPDARARLARRMPWPARSQSAALARSGSQALGYRTLFEHIQGRMTLEQARERICFRHPSFRAPPVELVPPHSRREVRRDGRDGKARGAG